MKKSEKCTALSEHEPSQLILHLSLAKQFGPNVRIISSSLLVHNLSKHYPSFKTTLGKAIRDNKFLQLPKAITHFFDT
jgi:hypothetical protein